MKNFLPKLISFVVVFLLSIQAYSQNLMFVYDYIYKPDSLSENSEKEPMFLWINNKQSTFASYERLKTDSLYLQDKKTDFTNGKIFWKINKNLSSGELTETQYSYPVMYSFPDDVKLNWELINETKVSFGYTLYKAKTRFRGRIWEAWYCSKIPINDGPFKFSGLPGMIFEISDTRNHHRFSLIKLYKTDFDVSSLKSSLFIEKKQGISKKEYLKLRKIEMADPARGFKADVYSGKIVLKDRDPNETIRGIEKKASEDRKKNNNPIELNQR